MPGMVLYEAHTSKVSEQLFFIGISKEGIRVSQTANNAHVVLVLITPRDMTVEDHLKSLSKIARFIRPKGGVKALLNAGSVDDVVRDILSGQSAASATAEQQGHSG